MNRVPTDQTVSSVRPAEDAASPKHAVLHVVHPATIHRTIVLGGEATVIGRDPEAETIDHPTVSRQHLAISWNAERGVHSCSDLGSRNGSRLDSQPLGPDAVVLRDGAILRLGDVILVYESAPDVRPALNEGGEAPGVGSFDAVPGRSAAAVRLRTAMARAAADPSPVLIIGETGTGKEFVARDLHRASGRTGAIVAVNCAALGAELIESELFGHVRGAFTGATEARPGLFIAADHGTLFLDEIAELPLGLQPKLLRAIQSREVRPVGSTRTIATDVRVISATNRDVAHAVEEGLFRRDLYARLSLWELRVPALRQRRADILMWLSRLHTRWLTERGKSGAPLVYDAYAAEALLLHPWPDNLRGLERLVHELAPRTDGEPITLRDLPNWFRRNEESKSGNEPTPAAAEPQKTPIPSREEFEQAFRELEGNVRALARRYHRDRRQIYRWIKAYNLDG